MIIKKESQESGSGVSIYVTKSSVSRARALSHSLSLALFGWPTLPPRAPSFSGERSDRSASTARTHDADRRQHSTTQHRTSRGWHCSCVGERAGRREQTVTVTVKVTVTVTVMVTGGARKWPGRVDGWKDEWMDGWTCDEVDGERRWCRLSASALASASASSESAAVAVTSNGSSDQQRPATAAVPNWKSPTSGGTE